MTPRVSLLVSQPPLLVPLQEARSAKGAAAGRSDTDPNGRPASSDSAPARRTDRDGSSRHRAKHSSLPGDRSRAQASSRGNDSRDKHKNVRKEGGRRDHVRSTDTERESAQHRERRSDRDSHHSRSREARPKERDRDRLRPADGHAPQRSRDRPRAHERPSHSSRDGGGAAARSGHGRPDPALPRDNPKRQRLSGDRDADAASKTKDGDSAPCSISSSEKGLYSIFSGLTATALHLCLHAEYMEYCTPRL